MAGSGPRSGALARYRARVLDLDGPGEIARALERTDSDPEGVGIMTRKARIFPVWLEGVPLKALPLLKQELLAAGGESAHARGVADHSVAESAVVLLATWNQYRRVLPKLLRQPFRLAEVAEAVDLALRQYTRQAPRTVTGLHRSFTVGRRTLVMGVVNVTPDSFSDGGLAFDPDAAVARALRLAEEGAAIVDVGGESTRPGAEPVSPESEWRRIGPVIGRLHGQLDIPISVDTRHHEVAAQALEAGADLVNDVSALSDEPMRRLLARTGAPAVLMHMRGQPRTMQAETGYADVRSEVYGALAQAAERAISSGIAPERLLIDPGLGFGKSAEQSLELLSHVGELRSLGYPVVVGASRKSFLGHVLQAAPVTERLEASLAAAVLAARAGAEIVRVHDVQATVRALRVVDGARELSRGGRGAADYDDGPGTD